MGLSGLSHGIGGDFISREAYKLSIEAAAIVLLCYIGFTDFRFFKIRNGGVLLLLMLYIFDAIGFRSFYEIATDVLLGVTVFAVLLWLYAKGVVGGGDVKLVPVVCLWVGAHYALVFALLLLAFVVLHLGAVKAGWAPTDAFAGRRGIPYGPSLAAALIGVLLLGCL